MRTVQCSGPSQKRACGGRPVSPQHSVTFIYHADGSLFLIAGRLWQAPRVQENLNQKVGNTMFTLFFFGTGGKAIMFKL